MTDIVYDFITQGVDLILVSAVMASVVFMLRSASTLTHVISNQQAVADEFNYYLEYHKYDGHSNLVSADVISAMYGYRNEMNIVLYIDGVYYTNNVETGNFYKITAVGYSPLHNGLSAIKAFISDPANAEQISVAEFNGILETSSKFTAKLLSADGGSLELVDFSRDTAIHGIYFEITP